MGKIICLMGKSSSGKDTIYKNLMEDKSLGLRKLTPYTTRPMREGEQEGVEYHFTDEAGLARLQEEDRVIEIRAYDTVYGVWKYFTVWEEQMNLERESYCLIRAVEREQTQEHPGYEELCRRFLADAKDFSEENLKNAGITRRFENKDMNACLEEIKLFIQKAILI